MDPWTTCPHCGVSVRAEKLEFHLGRVHPGGATTASARGRIERRRRLVRRAGWAVLVVAILVGAVALAAWLPRLGERSPPEISSTGEPYWGSENATVDVFAFEDYQCPFCREFELNGGLDHLLDRWVTSGAVRLVYKDLAFISEDSIAAAEASQAVWDLAPGNWTEWNRLVFERQGMEKSGWASRANLVELARGWGKVPFDEFSRAMDDKTYQAEVQGDVDEAREAGVNSTPSIVVGGRRFNALDRAAVDAAIEDALQEAGAIP